MLPPDLYVLYSQDPMRYDSQVREFARVPEDRYYTVSVWPVEGQVRLAGSRQLKTRKISKSDLPCP
jgi:hypothetical protein